MKKNNPYKKISKKLLACFFILILTIFIFFIFRNPYKNIKNIHNNPNKVIIAFGNSITYGYGIDRTRSFVNLLSEKTGEKIINAGRSGDTTEDALKRIEEDVLSLDPKLVLIEFGGNDFMQNFPQETTKHNLERMIDLIQKKGAVVILIAVPSISGSFNDVFKNIAKNKKCAYIPNILKGIMARPNLMIDQIHPNENGNKIVADKIYKVLKPVLEEMKK